MTDIPDNLDQRNAAEQAEHDAKLSRQRGHPVGPWHRTAANQRTRDARSQRPSASRRARS